VNEKSFEENIVKPVSVIFSRERTVGGEKIGLGIQAEIGEGESTDEALASVQSLVEQKLSSLAPSPEEQAKIERQKQAEEKKKQIDEEFAARRAELEQEFGDVLTTPVTSEEPVSLPAEEPAPAAE
jgi:hypothetical protein